MAILPEPRSNSSPHILAPCACEFETHPDDNEDRTYNAVLTGSRNGVSDAKNEKMHPQNGIRKAVGAQLHRI